MADVRALRRLVGWVVSVLFAATSQGCSFIVHASDSFPENEPIVCDNSYIIPTVDAVVAAGLLIGAAVVLAKSANYPGGAAGDGSTVSKGALELGGAGLAILGFGWGVSSIDGFSKTSTCREHLARAHRARQ